MRFLCLLAIFFPALLRAQPDAPEPRESVARAIERLALLDLRALSNPTPDDYRASLTLFTFAHELDPGNPDIIRRQVEAAYNAGDQDAVIEHTRALLLIDPTDTVATLRLITSTITRHAQSAEQRLAEYEKYLSGDKKLFVDASIRSRLALDAALLLRERGDEKGFKDKLVMSMQLDPTHKEAAAMAAAYFAERVPDDAPGRIDLLVNLLKADPIDPNIHMSISRELTIAGAYNAALRFHTNALNISSIINRPGEQALVENHVLMWYSEGPARVAKRLSDSLAVERDAAARAIRAALEARRPTEDMPKPEELFLSAPLSVMYVLAADAAGDRTAATGGLRDFSSQVDGLLARLRSPRTRGNMSEVQAARASFDAVIQLNTLRLWMDIDAAKYNESQEFLRGIRTNFPEAAEMLDALWDLRAGRPEDAVRRCAPLLPSRLARLATALAYEQLNRKPEAIELYRAIVHDEPLQPAAAWASSRIARLGGEPISVHAPQLERLVASPRVPDWIDDMATNPGRFLRVKVTAAANEATATDYVPITISITNTSSIPLALGTDRPICSRFLLTPKMEQMEVERLMRPEVVDLDRRLRLLPRETIEVQVWPMVGQSGWAIDGLANRSVRLRWRATQGFVPGEAGGFRPGPMCLVAETDAIQVRPLTASSLSAGELAAAIATAPLDSLERLAYLTRAIVLQPVLNPDPPPPAPEPPRRGQPEQPPVVIPPMDLKPVGAAFTLRYPKLPPAMRAMVLAVIPHARLAPNLAALDAAARADEDPLVRCVYLTTRVAEATDEYLASAKASDDARVRLIAQAIERRLASETKYYSRLKPEDIRPELAPAPQPDGQPK